MITDDRLEITEQDFIDVQAKAAPPVEKREVAVEA
jgi:hypothetical protein